MGHPYSIPAASILNYFLLECNDDRKWQFAPLDYSNPCYDFLYFYCSMVIFQYQN